jgi:hypothetical protein
MSMGSEGRRSERGELGNGDTGVPTVLNVGDGHEIERFGTDGTERPRNSDA